MIPLHLFFPLLLLLLISTRAQASPPSAESLCLTHHPLTHSAIETFCTSNPSIRVPSSYASTGMSSSQHKSSSSVAIEGACFPAQWVPLFFCKVQFWDMCAGTVRRRRFGRNACQVWSVVYEGDFVVDWFPGST